MKVMKNGSRGDDVKALQTKLGQLGYDLSADGIFGDGTEKVVRNLQTLFGYTVDGLVGEGTLGLIDAQVGYGWNASAPDATERALRAQGKSAEADAMKAQREAGAAAAAAKKG
ncbi:MAG: peptidoglycan-binding protein [Sandaracinus sp.]|nr:peptidoglycan-binding protein [Sandaracinus sp.]